MKQALGVAAAVMMMALSPAEARVAGDWACWEVNAPHDPRPVRNWLRGFIAGKAPVLIKEGFYQATAARIGDICRYNPHITLREAADFVTDNNVYAWPHIVLPPGY
ncbi:MAG TPA: hypothetical protein VFG05_10700 [Methylocella sp.]|nr:hypothetical protein [Methylocella sp.]